MRNSSRLLLLFSGLTVGACSEPKCRQGEQRLGSTCYARSTADAGTPGDDESADEDVPLGMRADGSITDDPAPDADDAPSIDLDASKSEAEDASQREIPSTSSTDGAPPQDDGASPPEDSGALNGCVPSKEVCNGKDDDCDDAVDEDPPTWYPDCDNDGAASISEAVTSCSEPFRADCTVWTDTPPQVPDCNDHSSLYSPTLPTFVNLGGGPNPTEERRYIGDMDCNGVVEKSTLWDYWDDVDLAWKSGSELGAAELQLCSSTFKPCEIGASGNDCYENVDAPNQPLGCGNTTINIHCGAGCCGRTGIVVRVICR